MTFPLLSWFRILPVVLQRMDTKCTKIYIPCAQLLFCSLNVLFGDVLVAIAIVDQMEMDQDWPQIETKADSIKFFVTQNLAINSDCLPSKVTHSVCFNELTSLVTSNIHKT